MYAKFYKLRKEPFNITPDPSYLYLSSSHKEAIATILYGIRSRKGFIAIVGEVGTGKTTIVRTYLNSIDKKDIKLIYLFNPDVTFKALLIDILSEFDVKPASQDSNRMIAQIHRCLINEYIKGRNVTLIIDEAQNMPVSTLESLRMLSNLETTKDKLLQIVLVGQPELEVMLNSHALRQLRSRIALHATIHPLTKKESYEYIESRLNKVALSKNKIFTNSALYLIVKRARGIPRAINILCDNTLITGYGYQSNQITASIVKEVFADRDGRRWTGRRPLVNAIGIVTLLAGLYWIIYQYGGTNRIIGLLAQHFG
jgi:general secretion pathway protein A